MQKILFWYCFLFPLMAHAQFDEFVNPFIGTGGHGHTYPGATSPFGMVQLSPDTRLEGWDGCSGYHYSDSIIYGFSHTHLSGTGVGDYCDILVMPGCGKLDFSNGFSDNLSCASEFDKKLEKAVPGKYECFLTQPQIEVRLSVTPRTGIHEYIFKKENEFKWIKIDLKHRDKVLSGGFETIGKNEISGKRISSSWAKEQHIYFDLKSSVPFKRTLLSKDGLILYCEFEKNTKRVVLQSAISAVDVMGAKTNLKSEWVDFKLEKAYKSTRRSWNNMLGRIDIRSNNEEHKSNVIFYSALYHLLIQPNLYQDSDNRYRGMDNKIHLGDSEHPRYTVFSLWDTYRAAHPLYQLIYPDFNEKFILSFLGQFEECGRLPVWELAGNETFCMIGNHSIPVMANALLDRNSRIVNYRQNIERAIRGTLALDFSCLENFKKGFISSEECSESVSKTIENSIDFGALKCIVPNDKTIKEHNYYKNLFNPKTSFFQAKLNHTFIEPFDSKEVNFHFTEANAWHYLFGAHHDVGGMMECFNMARAKGKLNFFGKEAMEILLDSLFQSDSKMTGRNQSDITGLIGQYAHGNEPSHHVAYLYNYCNRSDKTQQIVKRILQTMYTAEPDGLCGNEDCGQMSAWYIWSSLGFYPVNPILNAFDPGIFIFDQASIKVPGEKIIKINSNKKGGSNYVHQIIKNGILQNSLIEINPGDKIEFIFNDEKYIDLVINSDTLADNFKFTLPYISEGNRTFQDSVRINFSSLVNSEIVYKIGDPESPELNYRNPIIFRENQKIYFKNSSTEAYVTTDPWLVANFTKRPSGYRIKSITDFSPMYSAGGREALMDGLEGSLDFRDGHWQGFFGKDFSIEFSLDENIVIEKLEVRFLQDQNSWILLPACVQVLTSQNGTDYILESELLNTIPQNTTHTFDKIFQFDIKHGGNKFIKFVAKNPGKLPGWHLSSGESSWIFTDEIKLIKK